MKNVRTFGPARWLLLVAVVTALLVATTATAMAAQSSDLPAAGAPVLPQQAAEAENPFAVSDEDLAVAIFIPGILLVASIALVVWAMRSRAQDENDQERHR